MGKRLPSFRFERGLLLVLKAPSHFRSDAKIHKYLMIGRLEDSTPFYLEYVGDGVTSWSCPAHLGAALRNKILTGLREEVRRVETPPPYVTVMDFVTDSELGDAQQAQQDFHTRVWRAEYLNDRDEDYVDLKVPFEEKDAAKALGAAWDGARRVWKVKRAPDMSAFARWLPMRQNVEEPVRPE